MQTSLIGRNVLIAREGLKTVAYRDSVGVWTIGVGHTSAAGAPKVTPGLKITVKEAEQIFARDLVQYERAVESTIRRVMLPNEFDAFVSICYNIGTGAFKKSTFAKKYNAGASPEEIVRYIMQWTKPAEITSRRQAEADQLCTPYDVAMPKARATDRARVSDKKRHVAQNDPVPTEAGIPVVAFAPPLAGVDPLGVARTDDDMVSPTNPFRGLLSLFQGKPPVAKDDRGEVKATVQAEAPSIMKDLANVRTLGLIGGAGSILGGVQDSGLLDSVKASADGATSTFESVQTLVNLVLGAIKWGVAHWWVFGLILAGWMLVKVGWAVFKLYVFVKNGVKPNGG